MIGYVKQCLTCPFLIEKKSGVIITGGETPYFPKNATLGGQKVYFPDEL